MLLAKEKKILEESLRHECNLPESEDILNRYISDGYFVNLRRKIKGFMMCSEKNPRAKMHLRSRAAINYERVHHLKHYNSMIHPYSMARMIWESFMMLILFALLTYIPYETCVLLKNRSVIPKACLDVVCVMDIIINFRTGFQHSLTKKVIMNPRQVARNYLKTWFFIDVIATINADLLALIIRYDAHYWFMKVPSFLRIFRLMTLLSYLGKIREVTKMSLQLHKVIMLTVVVYVLVNWLTCFLYGLAALLKEDWFVNSKGKTISFRLRLCFLRVVSLLFLVSHGESKTESGFILVFEMVWMTCGFIAKLLITGQLAQMALKYTTLSDEYYEIVQHFREYMKSKNLPTGVRKKVFSFLEFRYQRKFYRESELIDGLSRQLKQEVNLHTGKELLKKNIMFKGLPDPLISRVANAMTLEIYLPNEVVVAAGTRADAMYFIRIGLVAIYSIHGKEICHLSDDSCFGEAALFSSEKQRSATVVAIDFCEMYALNRDWFLKVVAPYPEMLEMVVKICRERWLKYIEEQERESKLDDAQKNVRRYVNNI